MEFISTLLKINSTNVKTELYTPKNQFYISAIYLYTRLYKFYQR